LRLITAACASVLVALGLVGCGGGEGVSVNPTAADTAPSSTPAPVSSTPATPTPTTGSATLSWVAPTQNTDDSPLTNLAGYIIYYGTDAAALTQTIQVTNSSALSYVITGLAAGTTWYFTVTSYTATGEESARSTVVSKTI
jgi:Fibronectin type III domain